MKLLCINAKPLVTVLPKGKSVMQHYCLRIYYSPKFEAFILFCIISNTLLLSTKWYGQSESWERAMSTCNLIFAFIFTVEAAIKIIGLKCQYFRDNWNNFDFLIVIATLLGIFLD